MGVRIIGTGGYLPEKILTNNDVSKMLDTNDEWITTRTGIKQRHIARADEFTSELATNAAKDAMKNANIDSNSIDGVIVATVTPDFTFPSVASQVQGNLGIKKGFAFDIEAACAGFLVALASATGIINSFSAKRLLVIGADTLTKVTDWQDRRTAVLFGDGAGCVVLEQQKENDSGIIDIILKSDGRYTDILKSSGGVSTTQNAGVLTMQGTEVFKQAIIKLCEAIPEILQKNNINQDQVSLFIPHQANIRIIEAVQSRLNLDPNKVISTIDIHANTASASLALALDHSFKAGRIKEGNIVLLKAIGAGLTWGTCLLKW